MQPLHTSQCLYALLLVALHAQQAVGQDAAAATHRIVVNVAFPEITSLALFQNLSKPVCVLGVHIACKTSMISTHTLTRTPHKAVAINASKACAGHIRLIHTGTSISTKVVGADPKPSDPCQSDPCQASFDPS